MSTYTVTVTWTRGDAVFTDQRYSRRHTWKFDGGVEVPASSSPQVVRVPMSDPAGVDPEEALVAAISSCHMLSFLPLAAGAGFVVDSYEDAAVGTMAPNDHGDLWVAHVVLSPEITYSDKQPTREEEAKLHHRAHEKCFIANSVKTKIEIAQ